MSLFRKLQPSNQQRQLLVDSQRNNGDPLTQQWRPISFNGIVLVLTTVAILALLGTVAAVYSINQQHGAIFFARDGGSLSTAELFQIRYLPTILIVVFGTWILTLDLDIKRLEPWAQLSQSEKPTNASPLFCQYDMWFVTTIIANALRKRHWIVLTSSLLALLVTVIMPAVQASMFATGYQTLLHTSRIATSSVFASLEAQRTQMTTNFLLTSYSVTWLGQNVPAFTTKEYAIAPFAAFESEDGADLDELFVDAKSLRKVDLTQSTILSSSTRYWTELSCWAPQSIVTNYTTNTVSFDDGRGCFAADVLSFNSSIVDLYPSNLQYEAYAFGPYSEGYDPYRKRLNTECPQSPHLYLMTFRRFGSAVPDFSPEGNATAIFCEPTYYSEPVNATIRASDFSIISYHPTGPPEALSALDFNITHFEFVLTFGAPPLDLTLNISKSNFDVLDGAYVTQAARISNLSIATPLEVSRDVLIGFALGLTKLPVEAYLDMDVLGQAYNKAYQFLFAQAVSYSFQERSGRLNSGLNTTSIVSETTQTAEWSTIEETAHVVPSFTFAKAALLALAGLLCAYLTVLLPRRELLLKRNPDSFAEVIRLSRHPAIRKVFANATSATEREFDHPLHNAQLRLDLHEGLVLENYIHRSMTPDVPVLNSDISSIGTKEIPQKFFELSWTASSVAIVLTLAGVILLLALDGVTKSGNGIALPSDSEILQQLLFNFAPTIVVTLLEEYLLSLCRVYSFIMPMQELACGQAPAKSTLLVEYTSLSPQVLSVHAFRAGHYMLSSLSILTFLSSVSTVNIASIFILKQVDSVEQRDLESIYAPNVVYTAEFLRGNTAGTASVVVDAIYPNILNLTYSADLPTWTTPEYAYLPLNLAADSSRNETSQYHFDSVGYGAELQCVDFLEPGLEISTSFQFLKNGTTFKIWANYTVADGANISCGFDHDAWAEVGFPTLGNLSSSVSALEFSQPLQRLNEDGSYSVDPLCADRIVKGWFRGRLQEAEAQADSSAAFSYNATMLLCEARVKTQAFRLNTTADGDILFATALEPPQFDLSSSVNMSASLNRSLVITADSYTYPVWHNDTSARDGSNLFYNYLIGGRDWLNATLPPPSHADASRIMSQWFSRLFAVQIYLDRERLQKVDDITSPQRLDKKSTIPNTTPAQAIVPVRRLFMSTPNLIISVAILLLDFLVLVIFRLSLSKPFLPRMPFTIASQIAFVSNSHIVDEVLNEGRDFSEFRYGYGKFIGKDGHVHTGIELEPYVYKLEDDGEGLLAKFLKVWEKLFPSLERWRASRDSSVSSHELHVMSYMSWVEC